MSDYIVVNGKKYYEESYLVLANKNADRNAHKAKQYDDVVETLHVCDSGRYRNDTIESVIAAAKDKAILRWMNKDLHEYSWPAGSDYPVLYRASDGKMFTVKNGIREAAMRAMIYEN